MTAADDRRSSSASGRRVFLLVNTHRPKACEVSAQFCEALTSAGITVRFLQEDADALGTVCEGLVEVVHPSTQASAGCELVVVVGGDGTILRAAELAREAGT